MARYCAACIHLHDTDKSGLLGVLPCLQALMSPLAAWRLHTGVLAITSTLEMPQHNGGNKMIQLLSSGM